MLINSDFKNKSVTIVVVLNNLALKKPCRRYYKELER